MADIFTVFRDLEPIPPVLVQFTYGRGKSAAQRPVVFTRSWAQSRLLPEDVPHCQLDGQMPLWIGAHPMLEPKIGPCLAMVAMWLPTSPSFSALMDMAALGQCALHLKAAVGFHLPSSGRILPVTAEQFGLICLDVARLGLPDRLAADVVARDLNVAF